MIEQETREDLDLVTSWSSTGRGASVDSRVVGVDVK
ncbi:hypothetical protein LINPERPRIM_LOCUS37289, partial [Linum perenne]